MNRPNRGRGAFARLALLLALAGVAAGCAAPRAGFDPKRDGRFKRMALTLPLAPLVWSWMGYHILTEDRGTEPVRFEHARLYRPEPSASAAEGRAGYLLARYAPILVQETDAAASYSDDANRLGAPRPTLDARGRKRVEVDTASPAMYAFLSEAIIDGRPCLQLNYAYWFPEHPKMAGLFDPEAGPIEGLTLRVTLNDADEPMLYETVYNCGCYHRVWPVEDLERRAREEFGGPARPGASALLKAIPRRIDLYVPASAPAPGPERPVIFSAAGSHRPLAIGRESDIGARVLSHETRTAELLPYATLETGGPDGLGIFRADSLVAGADRPEAILLFPTGIYHAGTPRRRGAQLIHFDQYDYDDPYLLDGALRLPAAAWAAQPPARPR